MIFIEFIEKISLWVNGLNILDGIPTLGSLNYLKMEK
tara:strand:- start:1 stop:111 length:111 start_codon:yes stop_codon:yes gene_type:complete